MYEDGDYKCRDCHKSFDEPVTEICTMDDDAWGAGPSEIPVSVCPFCGSDEFKLKRGRF